MSADERRAGPHTQLTEAQIEILIHIAFHVSIHSQIQNLPDPQIAGLRPYVTHLVEAGPILLTREGWDVLTDADALIRDQAVQLVLTFAFRENELRSSRHGVFWGSQLHTISGDQSDAPLGNLSLIAIGPPAHGLVHAPIHELRPANANGIRRSHRD